MRRSASCPSASASSEWVGWKGCFGEASGSPGVARLKGRMQLACRPRCSEISPPSAPLPITYAPADWSSACGSTSSSGTAWRARRHSSRCATVAPPGTVSFYITCWFRATWLHPLLLISRQLPPASREVGPQSCWRRTCSCLRSFIFVWIRLTKQHRSRCSHTGGGPGHAGQEPGAGRLTDAGAPAPTTAVLSDAVAGLLLSTRQGCLAAVLWWRSRGMHMPPSPALSRRSQERIT